MPVDRFIHPCMGDSERVAKLTDFEFKVWIFYILTADDFGVLPLVASKLQSADRTLSSRSAKQLVRALECAVKVDLLQSFTRQGGAYVWSRNWQKFQKIRFPRQTYFPAPAEDVLAALTEKDTLLTRTLFATFHPVITDEFRLQFGDQETLAALTARERNKTEKKRKRDGFTSEIDREQIGTISTLARAGARETAKANGYGTGSRLPADGDERLAAIRKRWGRSAIRDLPPGTYDPWFMRLSEAYHPQARADNPIVRDAFMAVFTRSEKPAQEIFDELMAAVANHAAGAQWAKGMPPAMLRWLEEGLYVQRHEPAVGVSGKPDPWANFKPTGTEGKR